MSCPTYNGAVIAFPSTTFVMFQNGLVAPLKDDWDFFATYTCGYYLKQNVIKEIEGKNIPIKFNEQELYAKALYVFPFLLGHRVMFSMGSYKVNEYLDYMLKHKTYAVTIVDESLSTRAMQPHLIKNFKASDYFDVPNNSWDLKGLEETIGKAQKLCLEYKESKISWKKLTPYNIQLLIALNPNLLKNLIL